MLAESHDALDRGNEFDILIVGSGYGGAISAARLGYANQKAGGSLRVGLLERGREYDVGQFPEDFEQLGFFAYNRCLNPLGLYEYVPGKDIDVIQGCGLGGTSLINANVAITPDHDVFQTGWPAAIAVEAGQKTLFTKYYRRAARMLGAVQYARSDVNPLGGELRKVGAFREVADRAGGAFDLLDITVNAERRTTRYGVLRPPCTNCGNCVTGCNVGAKNTLAMNYLPMAKACGVRLITQVEVEYIEKAPDGRYRVIASRITNALVRRRTVVTAKRVILSAGSLGTAGILLRSADALDLPRKRLGHGFTGNGDFIALAYNTDRQTDLLGFGTRTGPRAAIKAGPTITTVFKMNAGQDMRKRFTVEDLSCPSPLVDALRDALRLFSPATDPQALDTSAEFKRWFKDYRWNTDGALNHTIGFLIMGHDRGSGRIELQGDQPAIHWQGAADETIYADISAVLRDACRAIGGTYIPNPRWRYHFLGRNLVTAHPLGGAATADSPDMGVVDDIGRVFDRNGDTLPGLYVTDGAIIPKALGVNPFLTISAFTERMVEALRAEMGLPLYDESGEADDSV